MQVAHIVLSTLERSINRTLAREPEGRAALEALKGRIVEMHLDDLDLSVWMASNGRSLRLCGESPGRHDLRLSGNGPALLRAAVSGQKGGRFPSDVAIEGNMEVARDLQNLLGAVEFDWEEALSGVTGDAMAHQLGDTVRGLSAWGRETREALERNLAEYLRDELRAIPDRREVDAFLDAVDRLRDDVERLAARLEHLQGGGRR
jgi:ubiquinone biosynthesis accessory factor UbiJ